MAVKNNSGLFILNLFIGISLAQFSYKYSHFTPSYLLSSEFKPKILRSDGDTGYRLPTGLDPVHYEIEITPYFEADNEKDAFTFDGKVKIIVKADKQHLNQLILHENVHKILNVGVTDINGGLVNLNALRPFERIRKYDFLKINLEGDEFLTKGSHYVIKIKYNATMTVNGTNGVFTGTYKDEEGKIHWYASTDFQPTFARQAFPCFDEPGFKSTFSIIINRPANFGTSYSNMKICEEIANGDRIKEIFHVTPKMSAYLVTFHISKDFKAIADTNNATHAFRVIARPNAKGQGELALNFGPLINDILIDYLGIDSRSVSENFNDDHIAVPDIHMFAMENWGSIHYCEEFILFDAKENSIQTKELILLVMTHEITHKWFGNLVTCQWWDNTWINEGLTSYFRFTVMDAIDKTLEMGGKRSQQIQHVLSFDSESTTLAMQREVNSPEEAEESLDGVSYEKGSILILMLRNLVSENIYRKALNTFLHNNAFGYARPQDVYKAFVTTAKNENFRTSHHIDIEAFMKSWVEEPGYPVLNVKVESATGVIKLQQDRFYKHASRSSNTFQTWHIPLTFTSGADPDWNNIYPSIVMTEKTMKIQSSSGDHWVIFNVQQKALYRVNYDLHNWQLIGEVLKNDLNKIHYLNRAQIVDDIFAFMQSKQMDLEFGLSMLTFLSKETNFFVWNAAYRGFSTLRRKMNFVPILKKEFDKIILSLMSTVINKLGYEEEHNETHIDTLNRIHIMEFACDLGHDGCIQDAVTKFAAFRAGVGVPPNRRSYVFCSAIHKGNYEDWVFLNKQRETCNNAAASNKMFKALGCTINEKALNEYLQTACDGPINYFGEMIMLTPIEVDYRNAVVVLNFIKKAYKKLKLLVNVGVLFSMLANMLHEEELDDMEQWLLKHEASIPEAEAAIKAIRNAREDIKRKSREAAAILSVMRGSTALSVTSAVTSMLRNALSEVISVFSKIYNEFPMIYNDLFENHKD